jgi:hypothetical protein
MVTTRGTRGASINFNQAPTGIGEFERALTRYSFSRDKGASRCGSSAHS